MPIKINNLSYTYSRKTPYEKIALDNINLTIEDGEIFGIIGHTGSGKSTLISHFNALMRVMEGAIEVDGFLLTPKKRVKGTPHSRINKKDLRALRAHVGMVFQYPEYQLFAESVLADVSFGPKNLRLEKGEIYERAKQALELVGLDFETIKNRSPFEISGGQKRRVAIAGVLAMRPSILVLDEPTSGLDPKGKRDMLNLIRHIHKSMCKTVIIISHNMDEIAGIADRIAVMSGGKLTCVETPRELFSKKELLDALEVKMPQATEFASKLAEQGFDIDKSVVTNEHLVGEIVRIYNEGATDNA